MSSSFYNTKKVLSRMISLVYDDCVDSFHTNYNYKKTNSSFKTSSALITGAIGAIGLFAAPETNAQEVFSFWKGTGTDFSNPSNWTNGLTGGLSQGQFTTPLSLVINSSSTPPVLSSNANMNWLVIGQKNGQTGQLTINNGAQVRLAGFRMGVDNNYYPNGTLPMQPSLPAPANGRNELIISGENTKVFYTGVHNVPKSGGSNDVGSTNGDPALLRIEQGAQLIQQVHPNVVGNQGSLSIAAFASVAKGMGRVEIDGANSLLQMLNGRPLQVGGGGRRGELDITNKAALKGASDINVGMESFLPPSGTVYSSGTGYMHLGTLSTVDVTQIALGAGPNSVATVDIDGGAVARIEKWTSNAFSRAQSKASISGFDVSTGQASGVNISSAFIMRSPVDGVGGAGTPMASIPYANTMTVADKGYISIQNPSQPLSFFVGSADPSFVSSGGSSVTLATLKKEAFLKVENQGLVILGDGSSSLMAAIGANSPGDMSISSGGKFIINGRVSGDILKIGGYYTTTTNASLAYKGSGVLDIRGLGSKLTTTGKVDIELGGGIANSVGVLRIQEEAIADVSGDIRVGNFNQTGGTITVDNARLNAVNLRLGVADNTGTQNTNFNLSLDNNAHLTLAAKLSSGYGTLSKASVVVQGNSVLEADSTIDIGSDRSGGGSATLTVDNSLVKTNEVLQIGGRGIGDVILTNSARIEALTNVSEVLRVGVYGTGTINMSTQSQVNARNMVIGSQASGVGLVTLSDLNTKATITDAVHVGKLGSGTLVVSKQAQLEASNVEIARDAGTSSIYLYDNAAMNISGAVTMGLGTSTVHIGQTELGNVALAGTLNTPSVVFGSGVNGGGGSTALMVLSYTNPSYTLSSVLSSVDLSGIASGVIEHKPFNNGTTYFTGDSVHFKGITNITKGVVSLGNGGTSGNLSGDIVMALDTSVVINRSNAVTVDGVLKSATLGAGSLVKQGGGTATLVADNIGFSGKATVETGMLKVGAVNALGSSTAKYTTNVGATLDLNNYSAALDTVVNAGTIKIGATSGVVQTLTTNIFTQTETGLLDVLAGNSLNSASLESTSTTLNGGVRLSGFIGSSTIPNKASLISSTDYLIVNSQNAIVGNFVFTQTPNIPLSTVGYLIRGTVEMSADNKKLFIRDLGLAWTDGTQSTATGTFDMVLGSDFEVDVALGDRSGSFATGWDGKSLTKKGSGNLVLSAVNSYTGTTSIEQGVLSVSGVGTFGNGTGDILLGKVGAEGAASLQINTNMTITNPLSLANRADNTIDVAASTSAIFTGSLVGGGADTTLFKTGAGDLHIAPVGNNTLLSHLNIAEGQVYFDIAGNLRLVGDIGNLPNLRRALPLPVVKTFAGNLLLVGNSYTAWDIQDGSVSVTDSLFNSNVTIADGAKLAFVHDPLGVPVAQAIYTGTLLGDNSSILEMNRTSSILNLQYNADSRIGDIQVTAGTLNLAQVDAQPAPSTNMVQRFAIAGDLRAESGSTVALVGSNTYLEVGGQVDLKNGSTLKIALDAKRPMIADITALNVGVGASAQLEIAGFAVPLAYDPELDPELSQVFRASALPGFSYLVMDVQNSIAGEFGNARDGTIVNTPSYLVSQISYQTDSNSNAGGAAHSELVLDNFRVAWLDTTVDASGNLKYANGTFNMEEGTAFNIDIPLPNVTPSTGQGFDSGWDGASLLKEGKGLLILSDSNNSYTGDTVINGGTLLTNTNNVLDTSSKVVLGPNGTLDVHNTNQQVNQLDNLGTIDLDNNGTIVLLNKDPNGNIVDSYLGGTVVGGNQLHNGGTDSTIVVENGGFVVGNKTNTGDRGNVDVDHIILKPNTTVTVDNGGTLVGQVIGNPNPGGSNTTLNVNTGGIWVVTDDSTVGNVNVGGVIDFGNPQNQHGQPGRELTVDNWQGNGGNLNIYGKLGSNNQIVNDKLVINGKGTGNTNVNLIDTGGLAQGGDIKVVETGPNGHIDEDAFTGDFISGTKTYPLTRSPDGGFGFNQQSGGGNNGGSNGGMTTPLYQHYDSLVGNLTRGSTPLVTTLGTLGDMMHNTTTDTWGAACRLNNAFATVVGSDGENNTSTPEGSTQYRQVGFVAGSDMYTNDTADGCVRVGSFLGYMDGRNDYTLEGRLQGSNTLKSKQVGSYLRYESPQDWYVMGSVIYGWDRSSINDRQDLIERSVNGNSTAVALEVGKVLDLNPQLRFTPSVQWLYQSTSLDGVTTSIAHTEFERVNGHFVRVGSRVEYNLSDTTALQLGTHIWHQMETENTIHTYGLANGSYLNSYRNNDSATWGQVQVGVQSEAYKGLNFFSNIGYKGDFSNQNLGITGQFGMKYNW